MLLINNKEIIEISSPANISQIFTNYSIKAECIPYIQLKRNKDNSVFCELGEINSNGIHSEQYDIQIGYVIISWIEAKTEKNTDWLFLEEEYTIRYDYSIHFHLNYDTKNLYIHPTNEVLNCSDYVTYNEKGKIKKATNESIISFFKDFIPLINEDIDNGISPERLNIDYYKQKYLPHESSSLTISIDDILDIIYSIKVTIKPEEHKDQ